MNKVILIGRLGRDPETRFTGNGVACCTFQMATDESYKDRNGEKQKRAEWHKIVVWGKPAEHAQKMLKKGSQVCVEGKIQSREYDKDGAKRTVHEVIVHFFLALDAKPAAAPSTSAPARTTSGVPRAQIPAGSREIADEDIPY
ncbi:MAG: single-stranded DNA-binding protein [Candidatus Acidiferrum sp.]